jgi:hypothetical protein
VFFGIQDVGKSPENFCEFCTTYTIVRILSSLSVHHMYGDIVWSVEVGGAGSIHKRDDKVIRNFNQKTCKGEDHLGDPAVQGRISISERHRM